MKIYKTYDKTYVENWEPFTPDDVEVEVNEIYHSESSKKFSVRIKLRITNEKKLEVLEKLNDRFFTPFKLFRYSITEEYDYRGRRTDQQHKDAENEAREALKEKAQSIQSDPSKYLDHANDRIGSQIDYLNRGYVSQVADRLKHQDPFEWDGDETEAMASLELQKKILKKQIDCLHKQYRAVEKEIREEKNKVILNEDMGDLPAEVNQKIKEYAKENLLFSKTHGFRTW